jgi:hypothetical protein
MSLILQSLKWWDCSVCHHNHQLFLFKKMIFSGICCSDIKLTNPICNAIELYKNMEFLNLVSCVRILPPIPTLLWFLGLWGLVNVFLQNNNELRALGIISNTLTYSKNY